MYSFPYFFTQQIFSGTSSSIWLILCYDYSAIDGKILPSTPTGSHNKEYWRCLRSPGRSTEQGSSRYTEKILIL